MAVHNDLGKEGERLAREFLEAKGFHILQSNYREQHKEADIICENKEFMVFAEVKTRADAAYLHPDEVLTRAKMRHLIDMADTYITENDVEKEFRFDLILVNPGPPPQIVHIDAAFSPSF
jgi:putative endonuclease